MIGDSVMVESVRPLGRLGFRADARMCRQWPEGREMVARRRRRGRLPTEVVIALGSNASVPMSEIRRTLGSLERRHKLLLVTPREAGGGSGQDAQTIREAGRRYPKRIGVLDWVRYARGRDHWFTGDGLHLKREYASRYLRCIKQALERYRTRGHPCAPR